MDSFGRLGPNTIPTLRDLRHVPGDVEIDEASQKHLVSDFLHDLMTCHLPGPRAVTSLDHLRLAHPADAASHTGHLRRCVHAHTTMNSCEPHRAVPSIHGCRECERHAANGEQVLADACS